MEEAVALVDADLEDANDSDCIAAKRPAKTESPCPFVVSDLERDRETEKGQLGLGLGAESSGGGSTSMIGRRIDSRRQSAITSRRMMNSMPYSRRSSSLVSASSVSVRPSEKFVTCAHRSMPRCLNSASRVLSADRRGSSDAALCDELCTNETKRNGKKTN